MAHWFEEFSLVQIELNFCKQGVSGFIFSANLEGGQQGFSRYYVTSLVGSTMRIMCVCLSLLKHMTPKRYVVCIAAGSCEVHQAFSLNIDHTC